MLKPGPRSLPGAAIAGGVGLALVLAGRHAPVVAGALDVALCAALGWLVAAGLDARRRLVETAVRISDELASGKRSLADGALGDEGPPEFRNALHALTSNMHGQLKALHEASRRDNLTGLWNRPSFQQHIEGIIAQAPPGFECALFFIDLDGFKSVNDTLGHQTGDRLLQIAADRLRIASQLPEADGAADGVDAEVRSHIARFGGDEFVLCLAHADCGEIARKVASRIVRVMGEPFEIGAHSVSIGASIGISMFPRDGETFDELLRAADTAMYHAKRSGRSRFELYDSFLDAEARRLAEEEQELREAVIRGDLELFYQPLFDLHARRVTSAEALIRWRHPHKGLLLPRQFLHVAERAGILWEIGEWVIGEAAKRIAEFERIGMPIQISVNVSPHQLERIEFVASVKSALQRWNITPGLLQIEVTEETALGDPELAANRLRALSDLGVVIAIDDFGTGYSNLASLIMLPVSRLKIDRSLLLNLTIRPEARVLVQTIVTMANSLGFHTVAEGVETEGQLDLLSAMGCDFAQGFLISRPVELAALRQAITSRITEARHEQPLTHAA